MKKWWQFWKTEQKSASAIQSIINRNSAQWSARDFSAFAEEGYRDNPTVRGCIKAKQRGAVECPILLVDESGDSIEKHPLLDLLKNPNKMQTWHQFLAQMIANHDIGGEGALLKIGMGKYLELWPLRPDYLEIERFADGIPSTWRYTPTDYDSYSQSIIYANTDVLVWAEYNPLHRWRGLSPLYSAAYSIDTLNEYARSNMAMLQNGMSPSGVLSTDNEVSDESFLRLQEQFTNKYVGSKNNGKPLLLEGGLKWQGMSFSPKDMEYISGKRISQLDICQALNVPPQIIGIDGSQTFANYEQARASFYEDEVIPLVNDFLSALLRFVAADMRIPNTWALMVDVDGITALEPRRAERNKSIDAMTTLTINEKRRAMGYQDDPEGDVLLVNSGLVPLDMVGADIPTGVI